MYNVVNTGSAVTITTTNNLLQDAFPTEASYFSINSNVFVAVNSSSKRVIALSNIANYNPLLQTPKQFLDALLTSAGGSATEAQQIISNNLLAQIVANTGGNAAQSYSLDFYNTSYNLPNTNETLIYLFRVKAGQGEVSIKNVLVSILVDSNKDALTRLSINQTFDHTFVNANFQDINSKIEYARPNVNGVPSKVETTGFDTDGRQLIAKYGREKTVLDLLNSEPLIFPEGITYSLTCTSMSAGNNIYPSISWNQID